MDSLRLAPAGSIPEMENCCNCSHGGQRWDRISARPYCPECQEGLALGETEALVLPTVKVSCTVCNHVGAVCYHTFPLNASAAVEMYLCAEHLRCLLGRRLGPHAFHQLRRQLATVGVRMADIFLLHEAFYDNLGRARQPVIEPG